MINAHSIRTFLLNTFQSAIDALFPQRAQFENQRAISGQSLVEQVNIQLVAKDEYAFIHDLYFDDSGALFAIASSQGKLYRVNIQIGDNTVTLGEWVEVVIEFPPVASGEETPPAAETEEPETQSRMVIRQQPDGRYRWISISCSSVLNRTGEIDSRELFDRFIQHAQESGKYPIRQFYHAGEKFRTGQCDFIGRDGYLLITSGIYDDTELARREVAARLKDPDYWGESIGFKILANPVMITIEAGIQLPVYTDGVFEEISTLPETRAASWMTATPTVKEVTRMLSKAQMEQFIKLFDGDETAAAKWLEDHAAIRNRQIEQQGVITRAIDPPVLNSPPVEVGGQVELQDPVPPAEEPVPAGETDPEVLTSLEIDEEMFALLVEQIGEKLGIKALADELATVKETLATLQEGMGGVTEAAEEIRNRLVAVEAGDDEKRQIWLQDLPAPRTLRVTHRPRTPIPDEHPEDEDPRKSSEIAASVLDRIPVKY